MEEYLQISKINDFIFCPFSIYLHNIFENYSEKNFHRQEQTSGKISHLSIDRRRYSTRKEILQNTDVYSQKYLISGKIDTFDVEKGHLVERKYKIKKIYDGYRYQLYAQYFCLKEMGYKINKIYLYSLSDNKKYNIPLPDVNDTKEFSDILSEIRNYKIKPNNNKNNCKCEKCVYSTLCN